jgi:hypothetical protein
MRRLNWLWIFMGLTFNPANAAENWPAWRGPRGDGTSSESQPPQSWDGTTGVNVAWKTPLAGTGHGSPVVWENRVFIASCVPETKERVLLCLDRSKGELLWRRTVIVCPLETKHSLNSQASCTPATDGDLIFVSFLEVDGSTVPAPNVSTPRPITPGQIVVAAYDFAGNQRWIVRVGDFVSAHGFCSNPVVHGDLVIVNGDHDGESYLVALQKRSGRTVWKTPRQNGIRSYSTPIIRDIDGTDQLVLCGSQCVSSFEPRSGRRIWTVDGPAEQFVASMVFDGDHFFAVGGYPTHHVVAVNPRGTGDVTESHVDWHTTNVRCYVPSPVLSGDYLFVADDRGTANCFDRVTGDRIWQARLGKHFSASLVAAAGKIYFLADDGVMTVVQPDKKPMIVAENPLGENTYASPALAQRHWFIRGERHLFCIGD